jgi:hypothetical protein
MEIFIIFFNNIEDISTFFGNNAAEMHYDNFFDLSADN